MAPASGKEVQVGMAIQSGEHASAMLFGKAPAFLIGTTALRQARVERLSFFSVVLGLLSFPLYSWKLVHHYFFFCFFFLWIARV